MIIVNKHRPRGIIWIASYPRSGNTWMRAFIHALGTVIRDPDATEIDINRLEEASASESAAGQYERFLGRPAFRASPAEIAAARPRVQAEIVSRVARPVLVKTHNAQLADHGVPLVNLAVSAGGIYVVRNPLDVAVSFAHLRGVPADRAIDDLATAGFGRPADRDNVQTITGSWTEHVRSWTDRPHPAVLVVRYEDMTGKPEETFAAVARHLMSTATPEQVARAIALVSFDRLSRQEAVTGFVEKPATSAEPFFREGRPDQWRGSLTAAQVERVVAAHGATMGRFGYLPG